MIRCDKDLYDVIHKIMGYSLISEDGIPLEKMHYGSYQEFYRRLLSIGVSTLKKEWDEKVKKYESKDDN